MADETQRRLAFERIQKNIDRHGHHVYVVSGGGQNPLFAYTIGDFQSLGAEVVLAGASFYSTDEAAEIIKGVVEQLRRAPKDRSFEVSSYGSFSLREVDSSWSSALMLGALDFHRVKEIPAIQVVPDRDHWTVDVPDLSEPWSAKSAGPWKWLHEPWTYPAPADSVAITDLDALRGEPVTEAMRWEDTEWELFAGEGPEVPKDEIRIVPIGTLLAADDSLEPIVNLAVGSGIWRDDKSDWQRWGRE